MKPIRADLSLLAILAESEAWVLPYHADSHPLALVFYVPAHLADDLKQRLSRPPPPSDGGAPPGRQVGHLRVLE